MTSDSSDVKSFFTSKISTILKIFSFVLLLFVNGLSMFELTNFQNWEILTRTPSSTSKMQLLHLHLGEEVHVEAMYSSSLHSGSSDDVALLVQHPSHVFERLGIPVGEDDEVGDDACFGFAFAAGLSALIR